MGTSSSYDGPTGDEPLLPDWAPDPDFDDEFNQDDDQDSQMENETEDNDPVDWEKPKRYLSYHVNNYGNQDYSNEHLKKSFNKFVGAGGGSSGSTKASSPGRKTARSLGGFLSNASNDYSKAFEDLGIDFTGKNTYEVISELVNAISKGSNDREESIARHAAVDVLSDLFEEENIDAEHLSKFEEFDNDKLKSIIEKYVSKYVYKRFMSMLAERIENNTISSNEINNIEWEIWELIKQKTTGTFKRKDFKSIDWNGDEGDRVINSIYKEVYEIMEGIE